MKYMLLLYGRDNWFETASEDEAAAEMEAHNAFGAFLNGRGAPHSGEALHSNASATTIRPNGNGDYLVTDGPFVDLKENLGGYYSIDAADLDDAIAVAKKCPIGYGIEIRPVVEFSE